MRTRYLASRPAFPLLTSVLGLFVLISGLAVGIPAATAALVVLDGSTGLKLADLEDAAGSAVMPRGGAATGMGGTAPVPGSSPAPWAGLVAAGALGVAAGAFRLCKPRNAPRRAR